MSGPGEATGLVAEDVVVRYGERVAVDGASLTVPPGALLALTGPSGAGKSSLLWALAGAARPASGSVRLDGREVLGRAAAARLDITFLPQGNALVSVLTARENVVVPLLGRVPPPEAFALADRALADVGLEESAGHLTEELSGGQQQRVAVARALARPGRVLLADEPTSDLDAGNRERVVAALRAVAARGVVVVMSTHDPEAAAQADGEVALDAGVLRVVRPWAAGGSP